MNIHNIGVKYKNNPNVTTRMPYIIENELQLVYPHG